MKIGIEIHQRLDTGKLFCSCPSVLSEEKKGELSVKRRLHPVLSELGEMDAISKAEHEKERVFDYQAFKKSNCLVELDEEPPHPINEEALKSALEIALALNSKPVDEIHIMRKTVIDGSNTSGFQRTAIIALGGHVDTSKGKVAITQIAIEEESAGIIERTEERVSYGLDRLGIPLVEITTAPEIKDREHLSEVAEKIGMILRATGKVARGLGTIRQDVNVSTEKGARVEIKGAQELRLLPVLVDNEVRRQEELLRLGEEIRARFNGTVKIARGCHDVTPFFKNSQSKMVLGALGRGDKAYAVKLPMHAGMLGREVQIGRRYGSELSDYAKLAGVQGIIHSDEDFSNYGLEPDKKQQIAAALGCGAKDAFAIVLAKEERAKKALEKVLERSELSAIPEETRKANPDGSTSFMRLISGKARLYPETDIPSFEVSEEFVLGIRKNASGSLEDKKQNLANLLNPEMAQKMLRSRHLALFEKLVEKGIDATLVATTLENTLVSLRREGVELANVDGTLSELFMEYPKGIFAKAAIPDIIKEMAKGKTAVQSVKDMQLGKITGAELREIASENGYDMGKIMQKYRLRVDSAELNELLKKAKK